MAVITGVPVGTALGQDCFNPSPSDDFDQNGLDDSCQNEATLGNGLIGMYYRACDSFSSGEAMPVEYLLTQVDANLDFEQDPNFPPVGVPSDHFLVRWTGMLTPVESGVHQLRARSDDGFRMKLNGEYVIERWSDSSGGEMLASIELEAGVPVTIVVEYYENAGSDFCELKWKLPSFSNDDDWVIVPSSVFTPSTDIDGDGYPDLNVEDCDGDGVSDAVEIGMGLAFDCDGNGVPDECDVAERDVLAWYRFQSNSLLLLDSSGNNRHLTGNSNIAFSSDRALGVIPRTGESNLGSAAFRNAGHLRFPDPTGVFALGDQSFTVEAWLKIEDDADTGDADRRQYLLQKKNTSGDVNAGFQILAQGGNIAAAGNWYGKSSDRTGNELVIRFGNGSIAYSLISRLQLFECTEWQHVSIAVDQENQRVRFEVNGEVEWQDLPGLGHVPGAGALRIGAHSTSTGEIDQELDGNIDELRIIRGVLPLSAMLDRTFAEEECPNDCPGDFDGSGAVDGADLTQLLGGWGTNNPALDLDGNGTINGADLTVLLGAWGSCL